MNTKSYLVAGGDMRYMHLAEYLAKEGNSVYTIGFDKAIATSIYNIIPPISSLKLDYIILPIIATNDGEHLNAPCYSGDILLNQVISLASNTTTIYYGRLSCDIITMLKSKDIALVNYSEESEFIQKNSTLTAKGIIDIIAEHTTFNVKNVLVLGYGNVAKAVITELKKSSVTLYVSSRDVMTQGNMYNIAMLNESIALLQADIIVNAIPALVLDKARLDRVKKDTLIIDVASKPGGTDFDYAKKLNLTVIHALAIPGRLYPKESGKAVYETITKLI